MSDWILESLIFRVQMLAADMSCLLDFSLHARSRLAIVWAPLDDDDQHLTFGVLERHPLEPRPTPLVRSSIGWFVPAQRFSVARLPQRYGHASCLENERLPTGLKMMILHVCAQTWPRSVVSVGSECAFPGDVVQGSLDFGLRRRTVYLFGLW
ncbi:uncharacterized protein BDV14DRAFT_15524 [Aspergillus stella-maris]|uniref:uncharacterized protein n=1 Tax=Aspergillus stella-maris TaxID=1810926 RepID=UPI003CCCEB9C